MFVYFVPKIKKKDKKSLGGSRHNFRLELTNQDERRQNGEQFDRKFFDEEGLVRIGGRRTFDDGGTSVDQLDRRETIRTTL